MVAEAQGDKSVALAHFEVDVVLLDEGRDKHKDEIFTRAGDEFTKHLAAFRNFQEAVVVTGDTTKRLE